MAKPASASEKLKQIFVSIGVAVTRWQQVELALTQLFAEMLNGEPQVASAIINSVQGFRSKLDIVRATATVKLKGTNLLGDCLKLCDRIEDKARKRNEIVHFMLYQGGNLVFGPNEIIDPKELDRRVEWYLSPTAFDAAFVWRHKGKPHKLTVVDIENRIVAFNKASQDIWDLSEKVRAALKRP